MGRMRIGLVGCGMISEIYLQNLTGKYADRAEVVLCADLVPEMAAKTAEKFHLTAVSVDELLQSDQIDLVLNLTIPAAHYEISKKALLAGKHAYSEKPLAMTVEEGEELVRLAEEKGLFVGSAPETFLGGGLQMARRLLDQGVIGEPVSVAANMFSRGPESFHPRPESFYNPGAGPLLDMGPYYITAMVSLLGPVKGVFGLTNCVKTERVCGSEARKGDVFRTNVDTNFAAVMEFESGLSGILRISWDVPYPYWGSGIPLLEIRGTKGTLLCPDPNTFGGNYGFPFGEPGKTIRVVHENGETEEVQIDQSLEIENSRGLGVWDLIGALNAGTQPRVNPALSLHVLEVMLAVEKSSSAKQYMAMQHTCGRPLPRYE